MNRIARISSKLVSLSLLAGAALVPATSMAATDPCEGLTKYWLTFNGNGYTGSIGLQDNGISTKVDGAGLYQFETTMRAAGEPADKVVGTCKNRHLVFTRTRAGQFTQVYDGWIFEKGGDLREVAGTFSHNGVSQYGFSAAFQLKVPR